MTEGAGTIVRDQDDHFEALLALIQGFQLSRIVKAAADLGLADIIPPAATVAIDDFPASLRVEPKRLFRLCRALAAFGIFTVDASGRIGHSNKSLLLRTDNPRSLHYMTRFWTMPSNWATWAIFDKGLKSGKAASELALGVSRMEYFNIHPDEAGIFNDAMAHRPEDSHSDVAALYDFSNASLIVDVGGGNGALIQKILSRYPKANGITFDRSEVIKVAAVAPELEHRHRFEDGDFLTHVPEGGDIYLLSDVLGNCSDEMAVALLRHCRAAIRDDGRLLVIERILADDPLKGNPTDYLIDLHFMLNYSDGSLRSPSEYSVLTTRAGFRALRLIPTTSSVSILECQPN